MTPHVLFCVWACGAARLARGGCCGHKCTGVFRINFSFHHHFPDVLKRMFAPIVSRFFKNNSHLSTQQRLEKIVWSRFDQFRLPNNFSSKLFSWGFRCPILGALKKCSGTQRQGFWQIPEAQNRQLVFEVLSRMFFVRTKNHFKCITGFLQVEVVKITQFFC